MWCFPARCLANVFLDLAERDKAQITAQRLHRLLYVAHGMSLADGKGRLVAEPFLAWQEGPILRDLFDHLLGYGSSFLPESVRVTEFDPDTCSIIASPKPTGPELLRFLTEVHDICAPFSTARLNGMTLEKNGGTISTLRRLGKHPAGHRLIEDSEIDLEYFPKAMRPLKQRESAFQTLH